MGYRSYMKELERKREEQRTMNTLNNTLKTLEKKRDDYAKRAKDALRCGNQKEYSVYVSLLKNAMFNVSQTRDMIANFTIAMDARDMQSVSRNFVKSMNNVMRSVNSLSKSIHTASSQKLFTKALDRQNYSAAALQQMLQENNLAYHSSVGSLSDIGDDEVKALLLEEVKKDNDDLEEMIGKLEKEFVPVQKDAEQRNDETAKPVEVRREPEMEAVGSGSPSADTGKNAKRTVSGGEGDPRRVVNENLEDGTAELPKIRDEKIDVSGAALRPQRLKDYLGQESAVKALEPSIKSALLTEKALPHVLLCGSYGQGKTTLAKIIAKEMGGNFVEVNSRVKPRDMMRVLKGLKKGDIVFIDEVHQLTPEVIETILYPAMEDFQLHMIEEDGEHATGRVEPIAPFTLIAATTESGKLLRPFYSKFPIKVTLADYTPEVIATIVKNSFRVFGLTISDELCYEIAKRSRLSPRTANEYVTGIRDLAVIQESERRNITEKGALKDSKAIAELHIEVKEDILKTYFAIKGVDDNGLDSEQRKILSILIENYNGGPVGQSTIAKALNVAVNRVNDEYEPYLVKLGLLGIGPNGRFVTDKGFRYMGKARTPVDISKQDEKETPLEPSEMPAQEEPSGEAATEDEVPKQESSDDPADDTTGESDGNT